jgi:hypothetical protein
MVVASTSSISLAQTGDDLPSWAYRLVRLGSSFARLNQNNRTDFLVLLVPTRSFASVFLAAGMVLEDLLTRIRSTEEHFQWLCSLPPGTILENEHRQGTIVEVDRSSDIQRLKIAIGDRRHLANTSTFVCHPSMEKWLPKNSLRPKVGSLPEKLAKHLVEGTEQWFISAEALPTVVICGERKELFQEVNSPLLGEVEKTKETCLEELLLANEYQYQSKLRRTRIESRRSKRQDLENPTERLVIYDGGRAFMNRAQDFRGTNQLLVMEYGDADLPEALQQVEGIWLDRVDDNDQQAARLPNPPPGCEMAHFQALQ